jgi:hypothetical protein
MKTRIPATQLGRTLAILITAFVLILLALGWEVLALRRALTWVDHTDEVIAADRELVRLTVDMETGWRGYLLTRDPTFLQPYREARVLIGTRFDDLNKLVADNPGQLRRLARIRGLYISWVRQSDPDERGTISPADSIATESSHDVQLQRKAQMDEIRAEHSAFTATEQKFRQQRIDTAHSGEELIDVLVLLVCFLGAGAAILAMKQKGFLTRKWPLESRASQDDDREWKEESAAAPSNGNWKSWTRSAALLIGLPLFAVLASIPMRSSNPYPFVLFYGAVSIVTWAEGLWEGFAALAFSFALADYFLIAPYGSFAMGFSSALGLVLCACVQIFICWLIDTQKQVVSVLRDQASLLDLSHDCIMVRDLNGIIQRWNHGAEEVYGFTAEEAYGRTSYKLLQTVFSPPLLEITADLMKNGRWEGELQHTTRDRLHIVVDSRWVLQQAGNGFGARVMETNNDITKRKKVEAELSRNTRALMRSNQELDEFAYAASHDLKAPLRVIFNASKWLEEDLEQYLTPETREHMDLMRRRVLRMEKLLDDLLEYSRIGRKKDERRDEVLSGSKLMDNILGLISLPEGFAVSVSPKMAGVQVKRMPLQQVLINLVSNAVKHHDKKTGCIEITAEDLGAQYEFAVRDDGPGIPTEFQEQIFKMFQTLKPRDQVEGSGMGLAMVRKYVEFAGGKIVVESTEGHGSTFRFTWSKQQDVDKETL